MGGFFSSSSEVDMDGEVAVAVNEMINSDEVVIFSKSYCPYCTMAKKVFDSINKKYTVFELEEREDCSVIQAILGKLTGATSVPRVFVKGKFIGGGTDVKQLHKDGKLLPMLS